MHWAEGSVVGEDKGENKFATVGDGCRAQKWFWLTAIKTKKRAESMCVCAVLLFYNEKKKQNKTTQIKFMKFFAATDKETIRNDMNKIKAKHFV